MRILITGITGFVGSHLAEYILSLNEQHTILGLLILVRLKDIERQYRSRTNGI